MTKIKAFIAVLLAAMVIMFVTAGSFYVANADVESGAESGEVVENIPDEEEKFEAIVAQFTEYLKEKYGEDYDYYYGKIIEQWGSIEAYLLSLSEELPEEYQSAWDAFVGWLGEYSPIWATALAVVLVIIIAVVGKKQFNMIVDRIVNKKLAPIINELNLQSGAMVSNLHALKTLLGNNEKFRDTVKELEESEKELKNG